MHDGILVGINTVLNDNPQLNSPYGRLYISTTRLNNIWSLQLATSLQGKSRMHNPCP